MPLKRLHAASWLGLLHLPHPNVSIKAATGEQAPIRAPADCKHRIRMREYLELPATQWVPEPHSRIIAPAGKQASIGGKSHAEDVVRMPARPEQGYLSPLLPLPANNRQGSTVDVPELDAAIIAPAGERAFVQAEGERRHHVCMRLPDEI